jgi:hypothetical protein
LGATSVNAKTVWSKDYKQLVETHRIRTKQGKDGQLIIRRNLMDEGKTLLVAFTLKLNEEPRQTSARQIWRKQAQATGPDQRRRVLAIRYSRSRGRFATAGKNTAFVKHVLAPRGDAHLPNCTL